MYFLRKNLHKTKTSMLNVFGNVFGNVFDVFRNVFDVFGNVFGNVFDVFGRSPNTSNTSHSSTPDKTSI